MTSLSLPPSLPPARFRTGSTDGWKICIARTLCLPRHGGMRSYRLSAAQRRHPSRFLFEPKMSNDSRRRRRLFLLRFNISRPSSISQERSERLNLRERAAMPNEVSLSLSLSAVKSSLFEISEGRWMLCSAQPERPASARGLKYMSSDFNSSPSNVQSLFARPAVLEVPPPWRSS